MRIRKDDQVEVISGDDKGSASQRRIAKVLRVLPEKNKIVVEGVNRVYKHLKPSAKNQKGGRLSKEMPIDASNVMLFCPTCNRGVRIGHRFTDAGQKQRYCKKCGPPRQSAPSSPPTPRPPPPRPREMTGTKPPSPPGRHTGVDFPPACPERRPAWPACSTSTTRPSPRRSPRSST
ncbi:MAG: 50S ribosomal protein L24 [Singulisphaera sp.]